MYERKIYLYVKVDGPSIVTSNNVIGSVLIVYTLSFRYEKDFVIIIGDDCIAINSGTANIRISGVDCGPGHGIRLTSYKILLRIMFIKIFILLNHVTLKNYSIGSLGKDGEIASVEDVCVQNCNFRGTMNGARIKTWPVR